MKNMVIAARVLLGIPCVVFGLNHFFTFFTQPAMPAYADHMLRLVNITEIAAGVLLLVGRFVPLALAALFPIVLSVVLFHVFVDRSMLIVALVIGALEVLLIMAHWSCFKGLLTAKTGKS